MTAATVLVTGADHRSSHGADLRGWSALPLLGSSGRPGAPWLFLGGASGAWLSRGPLPEAEFVPAEAQIDGPWPFGTGTLAGVVIDGEHVAEGGGDERLRHALREATRVAAAPASVLVVCADGLLPRRLAAWRDYGRSSAEAWRRAAAALGLEACAAADVSLDGDRVSALSTTPPAAATGRPWRRHSDRVVLNLHAPRAREADALTAIVSAAGRDLQTSVRVDRVSVRKIGKTALFLSGGDGRRYIMRIARSPIALARASRNFEALEWLHGSSIAPRLKRCVPEAVARGSHAGYPYFVETCLDGESGPSPHAVRAAGGWAAAALEYISALHAATQHRVQMHDGLMASLVRAPLARLAGAGVGLSERLLGRIAEVCESSLGGRTLPLVRTHGDFTDTNCLFDASGELTAVVDWEVSAGQGLPLLDLLQLMPIPGESSADRRWRRFDAWLALCREPRRLGADPVLGRYLGALDIPAVAGPGLVLMQWVSHVAARVEARRDDERWMRLRVRQPLESLGREL